MDREHDFGIALWYKFHSIIWLPMFDYLDFVQKISTCWTLQRNAQIKSFSSKRILPFFFLFPRETETQFILIIIYKLRDPEANYERNIQQNKNKKIRMKSAPMSDPSICSRRWVERITVCTLHHTCPFPSQVGGQSRKNTKSAANATLRAQQSLLSYLRYSEPWSEVQNNQNMWLLLLSFRSKYQCCSLVYKVISKKEWAIDWLFVCVCVSKIHNVHLFYIPYNKIIRNTKHIQSRSTFRAPQTESKLIRLCSR